VRFFFAEALRCLLVLCSARQRGAVLALITAQGNTTGASRDWRPVLDGEWQTAPR
jgi:hypothetical protein